MGVTLLVHPAHLNNILRLSQFGNTIRSVAVGLPVGVAAPETQESPHTALHPPSHWRRKETTASPPPPSFHLRNPPSISGTHSSFQR